MKRINIFNSRLSFFLLPLSWLYGAVVSVRNLCYDRKWCHSAQVDIPVISVGNLRVGGSGKTPLVKHVVRELLRVGFRPAIISRGYRRQSAGQMVVSEGEGPVVAVEKAGDEPYMLSTLLPEAVIIVDEDRVAAARTAGEHYQCDVIVMDDGFQHRALQRDCDIVLVPIDDLLRKEPLLPAGRLREPFGSLKRATHPVLVAPNNQVNWHAGEELIRRFTRAQVFRGVKFTEPVLRNPSQQKSIDLRNLQESPVGFVVTGIGDHRSFRKALDQLPLKIIQCQSYPDHYEYPMQEQRRILEQFTASDAQYLIMTAKDFVKWESALVEQYNIFFVSLDFQFSPPLFNAVRKDLDLS